MSNTVNGTSIWVSTWFDDADSRFAVHKLGDLDKWVVYCGDKPYFPTVFSSVEAAEAAKLRAMAA